MRIWIILIFLSSIVSGQIVQVPLLQAGEKNTESGRTSALNAMTLPFWDDFSFTQVQGFANDTLWEIGKSTRVTTGLSIDPPSIYSATFDGIDSIGKPYNLTDILAKGRADKLISREIRMDLVPQAERSSVYFSFYYQIQGKGEAPDQDDNFSLWWLNSSDVWEKVFEVGRLEAGDPTKFNYVILPVNEERFFHGKFRFRFQNFARLSGPYDMWHLDYVYLNKSRTAGEQSMPDRTISSTLTAPFKGYYSIPLHHLKDTFATVGLKPKIKLFGLLENNFQPFRYSTSVQLNQLTGSTQVTKNILIEDNAVPINPATGGTELIEPFSILNLNLQKVFPAEEISFDSDSVHARLQFILNSEDDNPLVYLPKYRPINFLSNDTIVQNFSLAKYYSRDDGNAEFGAGLNQPGTELGYGFDLLYPTPDTVVAVDLYFPQFGDQSNQTLILKLWSGGEEGPIAQLHQQSIQVIRTGNNEFIRYQLTEPVIVYRRFFVGWKQNSAAVIPVGFDKDTDSGDQIYYNVTGSWEQNTLLSGSLMIRPVFGSGQGVVINKLEDQNSAQVFPNPSNGKFRMPAGAQIVSVYDVMGRPVPITTQKEEQSLLVHMPEATNGIYLIRWFRNGIKYSARVFIKKD